MILLNKENYYKVVEPLKSAGGKDLQNIHVLP